MGSFKSYLAEFIGTFTLIFVGAGSVCMDAVTAGKVGLVGIALAHGCVIAAMGYSYGSVSGGHFNPALTIAMLVHHRIDSVKGILYIIFQLLGAAMGGLLLGIVLRSYPDLSLAKPFLGACDLSGVGFKTATLLEALFTFWVASSYYAMNLDSRSPHNCAPLVVGITVAFGVLAAGPLTGAALNPARAFGPALATGHWNHWYIYWIGPLAGACAAFFLYENLLLTPKK